MQWRNSKISCFTYTHYSDVIMGTMATQITSLTNVNSTVRSKKTAKLRVTGLCAGNSPVTGEFPAEKARNARDVSIWWCHLDNLPLATYGCQATSDNDCWPVMHLRCQKNGFCGLAMSTQAKFLGVHNSDAWSQVKLSLAELLFFSLHLHSIYCKHIEKATR